jgi:hypothetical protein
LNVNVYFTTTEEIKYILFRSVDWLTDWKKRLSPSPGQLSLVLTPLDTPRHELRPDSSDRVTLVERG